MPQSIEQFRKVGLRSIKNAYVDLSAAADTLVKQATSMIDSHDEMRVVNSRLKMAVEILRGASPQNLTLSELDSPGLTDKLIARYKFTTSKTDFGVSYSFYQPKGITLAMVADEINSVSQTLYGKDVISKATLHSSLSQEMKLESKEDKFFNFIPLVAGSSNQTRSEQERFLKDQRMAPLDRSVLLIGAGLLRLQKGYPDAVFDMITPRDEGDMLRGKWARTAKGSVASFVFGLYDYEVSQGDASANEDVYMSARLPSSK